MAEREVETSRSSIGRYHFSSICGIASFASALIEYKYGRTVVGHDYYTLSSDVRASGKCTPSARANNLIRCHRKFCR